MTDNRITAQTNWLGLLALVVTLALPCSGWCAVTEQPLTDADCIKCHRQPAEPFILLGQSHYSEVGCLGCHVSHPPVGEAVIPSCAQCHAPEDSPHFALAQCQHCHDAHAPQPGNFTTLGEVKSACLSCHAKVGTAMTQRPSQHATQDCSECHSAHGLAEGEVMSCLDCHDGHTAQMTVKQCLGCHDPHQPTAYRWNSQTPVQLCAACHSEPVAQLNSDGGAHNNAIGCSDCHQHHRPATEGIIPGCADCHDPADHKHYQVENCGTCHNPHAPLKIDLDAVSPIKPVCLSCHGEPGQQMEKHPTAHAGMDCNECHPQHRDHQQCLECHDGHSADMRYADCLSCHQPHAPAPLQFAATGVKPALCGSCHSGQLKQLTGGTSQHSQLDCVFCHKRTHKVILSCDNCHGEPHDSSMHQQFPDCSKCHSGPHNLRN